MTIQQAYKQLLHQLFELYEEREAINICELVIENITGFKKIDRIFNKQFLLSEVQQKKLQYYTSELLEHKPVQYVLHEAWFADMKFYVDENVLIPRPETEELVEFIISNSSFTIQHSPFIILDIGTGSGCIAIALKKKIAAADISAIDISENALTIAKQNAETNKTEINFFKADILNKNEWKKISKFDVIVSNPPYVTQSETKLMNKNVLQFEPHLALFVANKEALLFYKKIAEFGLKHLNKNGELFFEINELFGKDIYVLLENYGYTNIELKKDLQRKERMVKAVNGR